jgi:hypothetical protein
MFSPAQRSQHSRTKKRGEGEKTYSIQSSRNNDQSISHGGDDSRRISEEVGPRGTLVGKQTTFGLGRRVQDGGEGINDPSG